MSELPEIPLTEAPAEPSIVGPGRALREAREACGLSIADVAQALKFSPRQIEALEADDASVLPGAVFVRGFVRSYAKFLKLDPAPLLAMFQTEVAVAPPDVRAPENMGSAMPKTGVRQIPLLAAASVLLLAAAIVLGAWHFLVPSPEPAPATVGESAPEPAAPVLAPQVRVEQPAGAEAAPAAPAAVAAAMPAADARLLIFAFHGKSWVEVKDASQRVIFTGEYAAGAREVVSGRPPFQLVVGNAPQVELQYGDRSVDLKPYTRADVARLTLE